MKHSNPSHCFKKLSTACVFGIAVLLAGCSGGSSSSAAAPTTKISIISVSPTNVSIAVGYNASLRAFATYSDGSTANITSQVTWTSASPGITSVGSNTGVLSGVADSAGVPIVVTATLNGLSASANVLVSTSGGVSSSNLNIARNDHTASLLATGQVLVVGGYGISSPTDPTLNALSSVEIYNPVNDTWTLVTPLSLARGDQTSVTLTTGSATGKVLVAGGTDTYSNLLTNTDLFDPTAASGLGSWTSTCSLQYARSYNAITLLADGRVMVAGGDTTTGTTDTVEVYDPNATQPCTWTMEPPMSVPRNTPTATLLNDGSNRVLVTGGSNVYYNVNPLGITTVFASSELYDPANNTWTPTGNLTDGRFQHTATLLQNGQVLVAGGYNTSVNPLATAELYDPATGRWTPTGNLGTARAIHTATLLPNGKVLVMGGRDVSGPINSTEMFDPTAIDPATGRLGSWTTTANLVTARDNFTATLIPYNVTTNPSHPNGSVLAAGGDGVTDNISNSELYWW